MNNNSRKIIKALFLSATLALCHSSAKSDTKKSMLVDLEPGSGDGNAFEVSKSTQKIVKNVYKILRTGGVKLIAGHRSHSSHRSHRSSRGGHYSHSSSTYSAPSSSSHKSSGSTSSSYTSVKTAGDYSLGDRTLSAGIYGADVNLVVHYLKKNLYLRENATVSQKNGYYMYDTNVVNAVKHFQKDAGLNPDGKLTALAASTLRDWTPSKTTIPLGNRDLSSADEISGFDVDELVQLLSNAGCTPDPSKLKKNAGHYVYTDDLLTATKAFQALNGIQPSGELNSTTLTKLKAHKK